MGKKSDSSFARFCSEAEKEIVNPDSSFARSFPRSATKETLSECSGERMGERSSSTSEAAKPSAGMSVASRRAENGKWRVED